MEKLKLFRGIAIKRDKSEIIKENILSKGIIGDEGFWRIEFNDIRDRLEDLFNKPDLNIKDTRPSKWIETPRGSYRELTSKFLVICAADELGAYYYALVHNRHKDQDEVGLIISFEASINNVYIDGRDFLYTCFQGCDRNTIENYEKQKQLLVKIYGKHIEKYFEKAALSKKQEYRIAMCDLATQDIEVIKQHSRNDLVIGGRYGTIFKSAFFIKAPILSEQILKIEIVETSPYPFVPHIRLGDFINGRI